MVQEGPSVILAGIGPGPAWRTLARMAGAATRGTREASHDAWRKLAERWRPRMSMREATKSVAAETAPHHAR
jgi:hypothetical protein